MVSLKKILLDKNHAGFQFLKYSMCGGIALAADMVTFFLVAWLMLPALTKYDFLVRIFNVEIDPVAESARAFNFILGNVIAFMVSNMTAYILNIFFVFKSGKHNRWKELGLFYLVSGISVGIGVGIGVVLISGFGMSTTSSYVAKVLSTTLINYAARKSFIFNG